MPIQRINEFPEGSGSLSSDDIFLFMDDPSGSGITKKISFADISSNIAAVIVDSAPETLNTLNEIAAAIGDNENFLNIVAYSGDNISKFVNDVGYSVSGHTHTSSQITDFNSSVSGLLPVKNVVGSGYVSVSSVSGTYTVTATGLQPSGNYSTVGHSHTSSNITDFNTSVSGLLPVKDVVAGSNITVSSSSGVYTIGGGSSVSVANSGDNRILTSTGTSTGINAESNMTFDGSGLNVAGTAQFYQIFPTVSGLGNVSGTVNTNVSLAQVFDMTLTNNITLANPTPSGNSVNGVTVRWRISQDGTGNRTVTLGNKFNIPSSASSPLPWSTGVNKMDILAATYHAGRDKWDIIAFVPGY